MAKDLSNLPAAKADGGPKTGPSRPILMGELSTAWFTAKTAEEQRPTVVDGQRFRPSKAGSCSQALLYKAEGVEPTDPPDMAAHWSFHMGQKVHDWFDEWAETSVPGMLLEHQYVTQYPGIGQFGGNIDAYHPAFKPADSDKDPVSIAVEVKSINGLGYQQVATQGPRESALLQGAINAWGVGADYLVIVNMGLQVMTENAGRKKGLSHFPEQRFALEWWYPRNEFVPLAEAELARIAQAIDGNGGRRPLDIPVMAEITNPSTGQWTELDDSGRTVNLGNTWMCGYCDYQSRCIEDVANS